jgi:hypothetical protein
MALRFKPQHEFIQSLVSHEVPFCLVGGQAVQVHGFQRETDDLDFVWLRSDEAAERLLAALQKANACWISNERDPATGLERLVPVSPAFIRCEHLMMLWTDYGFVDFFDYIPGFPQEDVNALFASSVLVRGVRYSSLEWLKKMKHAAGRPRDLEDLRNLP